VSITLIATGFKRQEESESRSVQVHVASVAIFCILLFCILTIFLHAQAGGDNNRNRSSWFSPTSQEEGPALQIPEFLQRRGRSGFPRA
jgi:cell division protein FtsZ